MSKQLRFLCGNVYMNQLLLLNSKNGMISKDNYVRLVHSENSRSKMRQSGQELKV